MTEAKREREIAQNQANISIPKDKRAARLATVEQHIRLENEHDLEGVLRTFGNDNLAFSMSRKVY
jgi:hypothetical protein